MPETKKALIVVRTYPVPARQGVEVSCTAAITDKGEWLRLFPVPYRRLENHQKFHKYQWIEVGVTRSSDPRPESHKIWPASIKVMSPVLPTDMEWQARRDVIGPLISTSLCAIKRRRDDYGYPTLGIFKPAVIERLVITPTDTPTWSDGEMEILGQGDLFDEAPPEELEKIPFDFRYDFRCTDRDCTGHSIKCTDWEMAQSFRKWRTAYSEGWEEKLRLRYEYEMIHKNDTHFYVGTMHKYPGNWIIVGLFYPPKSKMPLFPD